MADLNILITDENGETIANLNVYLDGGDYDEAAKIRKAITDLYHDQDWTDL